MKYLLFLVISYMSFNAHAQSDEATLIFKRPWLGAGDNYIARISINNKEICALDSDSDRIATCSAQVKAGEIAIKTTSMRGSDFDYVIDITKNKTYTLVVYIRNNQSEDMIWSHLNLIKNKVKESAEFNRMSLKMQVISVE